MIPEGLVRNSLFNRKFWQNLGVSDKSAVHPPRDSSVVVVSMPSPVVPYRRVKTVGGVRRGEHQGVLLDIVRRVEGVAWRADAV